MITSPLAALKTKLTGTVAIAIEQAKEATTRSQRVRAIQTVIASQVS